MLRRTYRRHAGRTVREASGHEGEILASIRPLSMECKEGIFLVEEELGANDPDLDERCGLLDDRHEVFAVRIPGCRSHRLAVSMDLGSRRPPPVTIHGAVRADGACLAARRLATVQLNLINPSWE